VVSPDPRPAAVLRLHELLLDAPETEQVSVDLGFTPGETESMDSIVVGLTTDDIAAVTGTTEHEFSGRHEQFEISCMAQSVSGEGDAGAVMARVYELADVVDVVLARDRELGGGISWGRATRHELRWVDTDAGPGALLIFPISVDAFRDHEES
jgi:hypothetical protein